MTTENTRGARARKFARARRTEHGIHERERGAVDAPGADATWKGPVKRRGAKTDRERERDRGGWGNRREEATAAAGIPAPAPIHSVWCIRDV